MTRIPGHIIGDAPEASRALLADMVQFWPAAPVVSAGAGQGHG